MQRNVSLCCTVLALLNMGEYMHPFFRAPYLDLTTDQVKAKLDRGDPFRFIDVREPEEYAIARIEGAELLPLSRAAEWIGTLDPGQEYVFFCHHGQRSAYVAAYVASNLGFTRVANMTGGIEEWSLRIDPSVPRY
ncbi:Rhodanese domain protein [Roseiflexus castenholzii DSM 13941]|uniref:Rhodanese domain protein n=2 Tax=Roseiflexaceae TaxID=1508635 RepID=A7NK29_ROSCS|nr:Rhodanese domain protein [Roseiflexus castenholzii DSM 13941]